MKNQSPAIFPRVRLRRLRRTSFIRDMVQENHLSVKDLIWPLFVIEGERKKEVVTSMPGVFRYSIDLLVQEIKEACSLGIACVALFPRVDPKLKGDNGSEAINENNLICRAISAVKKECPEMGIMCDVALDPYTSHGHDGIIINDDVDNDATVEILVNQALIQAQAGCDILGPSDMMDGRIGAIRDALEQHHHKQTLIMAYAAKYASAFYGPFRDAVGSRDQLKNDKASYQQNPANGNEALREVSLDIGEGADMVMVKPGLPYLDILYRIKSTYLLPTFSYHVSGEYAMVKAAAEKGWLDENQVFFESLLSFKRAGADGILTYCAKDMAEYLAR